MKHKDKVKMARKMLTPDEIRAGVPMFNSKAWLRRSAGIEAGLIVRQQKRDAAKTK